MAKPKAQTIQQRFGFMDDDLKKPKHDELMKWLDGCIEEKLLEWIGVSSECTAEEIVEAKQNASINCTARIEALKKELEKEKYYPAYGEKGEIEKAEKISNLEKQIEWASKPVEIPPSPSKKPPVRITKKQWEKPIKSNDYIVGFVDMVVHFALPKITLSMKLSENGWKAEWGAVYSAENRIDFEVKTEIPSLGELIRQINMYKSYGAKNIFVVAPDDTHREILQEQGIGFIKYQ